MLFPIGELARRAGLTVKTVRYYSDQGIVPPTDRTPAGDRRYDTAALARLRLVRTLRELGLDLRTIRAVMDRERTLPEVAATHAAALELQIRTLRLRQAVLTAVATRDATIEEMDLMHELATLTGDFLQAVFGDLDGYEGFARSLTPHLPEDPTPEQVEAWVHLAALAQDPDFRAHLRTIAEHHAADHRGRPVARRDAVALVRDLAGPLAADPAASAATVAAVMIEYARTLDLPDDEALRQRLLTRLEAANDPRREDYERHLAVINGWPPPETLAPVLDRFIHALRAPSVG
ncbi:MerR family transcriptional regulator [Actinoplanes sp. NPDC051494]|uniref:MerR family transcriptional regulator n=1 Tax=Actinoplanes sp. NPDC051494 TaxID=3363907 RepID=UPI0037A05E2C